MAGQVYRHGDGWQALVVDGYGRGAKRKVIGTFPTKAMATAELRRAEVEVQTGTLTDRQAGRVSLVERMRADIERRSDRSHNTTVAASNAVMHAERFFGARSIAAVKHSDLQAFVSSLDLAPSSVSTVFAHVKASLRSALADGVLGRDPSIGVKLPKAAGSPMEIPTDADVERLHRCAADGFGVAVVLAAGAGLRAQEAAGLVVDDVDFLRRELHVHRQFHGRLGRFEALKTPGSTRTVPVGDDVLAVLAAHLGEYGEGALGVLLHTLDGRPVDQALFQARWRPTRKRAGLELRFHSLRHHYASTAISAGVPLPRLSKALGHSKPSVTLDVYGHLMAGDDDRLRDATTVRFGRKQSA